MRLLTKLLLTAGMVFAISTQASAISVDLVPSNPTPAPSDNVTFQIAVTLNPSDALTGVFVTIDSAGASFVSGTEAAYSFVNGVLLTPIGAAGADIGPILGDPNRIGGFEAQTLAATGAPGGAGITFNIGSATYHIGNGSVDLTMDTSVGDAGGTVIGGANFVDVTGATSFGNFHIVPEPTTAGLMTLGLLGLVVAGRRR